ncbi:MAG: hypothetical protein ACYC1C_18175 [Chloroflexota bacterium]
MQRFSLDRLKGISMGSAWCRSVMLAELVVLLLAAVALTIMPIETLGALAALSAGAYALAVGSRPVVALVGLALVLLVIWALLSLRRGNAGRAARTLDDEIREAGDPLRPAA